MILHPSPRTLSALADGRAHPRAARHLERCARCRDAVARMRDLAAAARDAAPPPPPADALARILAARAAGERVLLPVTDPAPPRRRGWRGTAAVAAAAAAVLAAIALSTPEAAADASDLRFFPSAPTAGETVRVEYRAGPALAGHARLRVRAVLMDPSGQPYGGNARVVVLGELRAAGDGRYVGQVTLPDSVVYAALAVEDSAAAAVDHNRHRLWELLLHGGDGRPLLAALRQRQNFLHGRNWQEAAASAHEAARLYPRDPGVWNELAYFQRAVLGRSFADTAAPRHRARFAALEREMGTEMDGARMGEMLWYANALGDTAVAARWRDRLLREHPRAPVAVQLRAVGALRANYARPMRAVAALDSLYDEAGPAHPQLLDFGVQAAMMAGDADAIRRWTARRPTRGQEDRLRAARVHATVAALRPAAGEAMRAGLAWLEGAEVRRPAGWAADLRGVDVDAAGWERELAARRRALLAELGRLLLAEGRTAAALETLALATDGGWDLALMAEVADARLAAGDTVGTGPLLARVAADPATPAARADSLRRLVAGRPGADWAAWTAAATAEMRAATLAEATLRPVAGRVRLTAPDGRAATLSSLVSGRPAVVVLWSRFCGPAVEASASLRELGARAAASGARLVVVAEDDDPAGLGAWLAANAPGLEVWIDDRGEATRAFQNWGTPSYYVLDDRGRIRFDRAGIESVPRQLAALSASGAPRGGAAGR